MTAPTTQVSDQEERDAFPTTTTEVSPEKPEAVASTISQAQVTGDIPAPLSPSLSPTASMEATPSPINTPEPSPAPSTSTQEEEQTTTNWSELTLYCNEGSEAQVYGQAHDIPVKTDNLKIEGAKNTLTVGEALTLKEPQRPEIIGETIPGEWQISDEKILSYDAKSGAVKAVGTGTAQVIYTLSGLKASLEITVTPKAATLETQGAMPIVSYQTHIQNIGWQGFRTQGAVSGTTGQSKRLESIVIKLNTPASTLGLSYKTHVQDRGWLGWSSGGAQSGTTGQSKRLEAIQINLTGSEAGKYDIYYRVHAQNFGWMGWAKNGASAGTAGFAYRLEAIQIVVVAKGAKAPGSTANVFREKTTAATQGVVYQSHCQNVGWQDWKTGGELSGTSGMGYRMEALRIRTNVSGKSVGVSYRAHVQNIGWQGWSSNGALAGTTGRSLRVEAIQIKITGKDAGAYDIYYQVHVQNYGWLDWAKNGASAGTSGGSLRAESLRIVLVPKGSGAPGATATSFINLDTKIALDKVNLSVSGLKHSYKFLYIADTHVISISGSDSQQSKNVAIPRRDMFTSRSGKKSAELFPYWIKTANNNGVNALLMGGDIIDYPSDANISLLDRQLKNLNSPYLYTLGNHDWSYAWQNVATAQSNIPKLDRFTAGSPACHTLEYDDLVVVALDDSITQFSKAAADGLEAAVNKGKPVIVMFHIPLASPVLNRESTKVWGRPLTIGTGGYLPNTYSKKVMRLINQGNVVGVLSAHVHLRNTATLGGRAVQYVTDASYRGGGMLLNVNPR